MNGFTATSVGAAGPNGPWPFNPGPSWHVKGDADFDFDGRSDILWHNNDGMPVIWLMNGLAVVTLGAVCTNPGPTGTSRAPAISTSTVRPTSCCIMTMACRLIWLMDGFNALQHGMPAVFNPGPSWQIKGTGNFNNDGRSDIVWQNDDGTPAHLADGFPLALIHSVMAECSAPKTRVNALFARPSSSFARRYRRRRAAHDRA